jgi:hypothetical protein
LSAIDSIRPKSDTFQPIASLPLNSFCRIENSYDHRLDPYFIVAAYLEAMSELARTIALNEKFYQRLSCGVPDGWSATLTLGLLQVCPFMREQLQKTAKSLRERLHLRMPGYLVTSGTALETRG